MKTKLKKLKKVIITATGTGGHITPGLAVANLLRQQGTEVLWIGGKRNIERQMVEGHDFAFQQLAFHSFRSGTIFNRLLFPWKFLRSLCKVIRLLMFFSPDAVIGFGGYTTGVVGLAAFLLRKPLYIHEQNAKAGMTNIYLSKISRLVFAAFANSFPKKKHSSDQTNIKVIGNPLPEKVLRLAGCAMASSPRNAAEPLKILVLGGSQGALFLNEKLAGIFHELSKQIPLIIIHQAGAKNIEITKQVYSSYEISDNFSFSIEPFISDMESAYKQADCIICRAGALTVSEVAAVALPSILIPYPYAQKNHQLYNARYLEENGAAYIMQEKDF